MAYWHSHYTEPPWCIVQPYSNRGITVGSTRKRAAFIISDYTWDDCPYRDLMVEIQGEKPMTSPTLVRLPDGSDVNGSDLTCEGCGSDMAGHACAGSAPAPSAPTVTRSTGPRKPKSEREPCTHCGGALHFNMGATAVNAECMVRQYALDNGLMTDPNGRLPVLTLVMMGEVFEWGSKLSTPLTYGKMENSAGGAATYAGLRPKTGRKKKVVAAAPGAQIQDMADEESAAVAATADPAAKPKRVRKPKLVVTTVADDSDAEEVDWLPASSPANESETSDVVQEAEEILASAEGTSEQDEPSTNGTADAADPEAAAREERAARRARRKAALSGK